MDGDTFRSRLLTLLQRSRQAHRLYSSMERGQRGEAAEFTEMQAAAWRSVNAELIKQLTTLLDAPHSRQLSAQVSLLRDRFLSEFRVHEAEVHQRQRDLILASEKGDFVRSAVVSKALVGLKAKVQACNAAFVELEDLVSGQRSTRKEGSSLDGGRADLPHDRLPRGGEERAASGEGGEVVPGARRGSALVAHDELLAATKTGAASGGQRSSLSDSVEVFASERRASSGGGVGSMPSGVRETAPGFARSSARAKVIPLRKRS